MKDMRSIWARASFWESAEAGRTGSRALVEFSALQEPGRKAHTDGAWSGNVYGCYVHGIFDAPGCAKGFVSALLKEKGYDPSRIKVTDWKAYKEEQYDSWRTLSGKVWIWNAFTRSLKQGNRKDNSMQKTVRIGSRESLLAVRQAEIIRDQILRLCRKWKSRS